MAFEKGNKLGKGRPPKADEEKVNNIFLTALKQVYDTETDDETKIAFIKDSLLDSQRGQLFIAEHLFGKPKETIDQNVNLNSFSLKDVINFDK
jgi:hypothetical protein